MSDLKTITIHRVGSTFMASVAEGMEVYSTWTGLKEADLNDAIWRALICARYDLEPQDVAAAIAKALAPE